MRIAYEKSCSGHRTENSLTTDAGGGTTEVLADPPSRLRTIHRAQLCAFKRDVPMSANADYAAKKSGGKRLVV